MKINTCQRKIKSRVSIIYPKGPVHNLKITWKAKIKMWLIIKKKQSTENSPKRHWIYLTNTLNISFKSAQKPKRKYVKGKKEKIVLMNEQKEKPTEKWKLLKKKEPIVNSITEQ